MSSISKFKREFLLKNEVGDGLKYIPEDPAQRREFLKTIEFAMELMNNPKRMREFRKEN
ncbi:hypothetical protein GF327_05975 [Candidatus Woesearchaeota archaeon]|nr:hypothetical protein [Candidatus Woesearchaeota archaeon]